MSESVTANSHTTAVRIDFSSYKVLDNSIQPELMFSAYTQS